MSQKRAGVLEVLKQMGPGYMQSAMTLGGGTAFAAIFGGAAFGYRLLWVAPVSMALGVVVLSAVAHQTLCTGEDPFRAMKRHAGPFFAYGWGIAAILSSIIWQFAQYALAASMLVLLADQLGWSDAPRWAAGLIALVWCVAVGLLYDRSARLVRVYENVLKGMVWLIIVCFLVVVIRTGVPDPGALLAGFVPSVPEDVVTPDGGRISAVVVIVSGLAAAVGVNMLFVYPYTLRKRGWGRDDRRMAGLDLVFGMLVPYAIAASLILIASASTFHFAEPELFTGKRIAPDQVARVLASPDRLGPVLGVWVFGLGIVAMALSSITMQMLCSGFACETVFGWERGTRRYTRRHAAAGDRGARRRVLGRHRDVGGAADQCRVRAAAPGRVCGLHHPAAPPGVPGRRHAPGRPRGALARGDDPRDGGAGRGAGHGDRDAGAGIRRAAAVAARGRVSAPVAASGFVDHAPPCMLGPNARPGRRGPPTTVHGGSPMPTTTPEHDERIRTMTFSSVYPHYVSEDREE
jgi:manganese transport protein